MRSLFILALIGGSLVACASMSSGKGRRPAGEAGGATGGQVFRLHSGRKVLLPRRSDSLDYVFLQGFANLEALNQVLAKEDLTAIPMANGQGSLGVIVARYNSSSIGPYQEVMVVISAQPKSLKESGVLAGNLPLPLDAAPPPTPYYVWSSQVDSPLAIEMGREVWGIPSVMGVVDLTTKSTDWTFRLSQKSKGLVFEGKCGNCGMAGKQKLGANFTLISGYTLRRSLVHAENYGPTLVRPFDPGADAFVLKPNSAVATLFKKVNFQPYGWFVGEGLEASAF